MSPMSGKPGTWASPSKRKIIPSRAWLAWARLLSSTRVIELLKEPVGR